MIAIFRHVETMFVYGVVELYETVQVANPENVQG